MMWSKYRTIWSNHNQTFWLITRTDFTKLGHGPVTLAWVLLAAADVVVAPGLGDGERASKKNSYSPLDFSSLWLSNITEMKNQVWSVWMKGIFWDSGSICFCKHNKSIRKVSSPQQKLVINRSQRCWVLRKRWRMIRKRECARVDAHT